MTDFTTTVRQLADHGRLSSHLSSALAGFGGHLRCETCGAEAPLGDPGRRVMGVGWPKCCGYTMQWWTQRQIDDGEMPPHPTRP